MWNQGKSINDMIQRSLKRKKEELVRLYNDECGVDIIDGRYLEGGWNDRLMGEARGLVEGNAEARTSPAITASHSAKHHP